MKYVDSGSGKLPLISLIAILSISLTVNLPGLAISPIMDKLDHVFKHVTELEVQLLTVLPNLVTIPFILGSGKICTLKNQIAVLATGLIIFTVAGVLYLFANSMVELIVLSCLLGVGCGLVIPLAASLISQNFSGEARTRSLGFKSGLSNGAVIFATLFVGWVAAVSWHLAFLVYLVPVIPLCMLPFMTNRYISRHRIIENTQPTATSSPVKADGTARPVRKIALLLAGVMAIYFLSTYGVEAVAYYLPFTMQHYGLDTAAVGVATAMFYLSAMLSGFALTKAIAVFGRYTMLVGIALASGGLLMVGLLHTYWAYVVGVFIMGLGYGLVQPVIYDKTSALAPTAAQSTRYFAWLLTCNYIGISLVPFIVSGGRHLFHAEGSVDFSFIFNAAILAILFVVAFIKRRSFVVATK